MTPKRLLLIDQMGCFFHLLHHRSQHKAWDFISDIKRLIVDYKIDRVVMCGESGKSKYRLGIFPEYKLKRAEQRAKLKPEDIKRYEDFLKEDVPDLELLCSMVDIPIIKAPKVEGDDLLAYFTNHLDLDEWKIIMMTPDADMLQCIKPGVVVGSYGKDLRASLDTRVPAKIWLNTQQFQGIYEMPPTRWSQVKALGGCKSDAIPSPQGIGETFAIRLLQKYESLENIEANLETLSVPRLGTNALKSLQDNFDMVWRNLKITELNYGPEVELEIFGAQGLEIMQEAIADLSREREPKVHEFKEYLLEYGKIGVAEKADFWLQPFAGRF